jgi:hypothetical protein
LSSYDILVDGAVWDTHDNRAGATKKAQKYRKETGLPVRVRKVNPAANPHGRVKLPAKWTAAQVRVNDKGQLQVKVGPSKVGKGRVAKNVRVAKGKRK